MEQDAENVFSRFEGIVQAIPTGIIIYALDAEHPVDTARVRFVNTVGKKILGGDVPLAPLREVFPDAIQTDFPQRLAHALVGEPQTWDFSYGDARVPVGVYACRAMSLGDGEHVAIMYEDVTEQRRAERAAAARHADLEEYAYITAHDLRSPLRAISELARFLEEDLGAKLKGEDATHLRLIGERARRVDVLMDGLAKYFRDSVDKPTKRRLVNLKNLGADIWHLYGRPELTFENDADIDIVVDDVVLQRVVSNLIDNAVKHHPGPTGTVSLSAQRTSGQVRIEVADDGAGIVADQRESAFRLFQTLNSVSGGTGIGLSLVRQLARRIDGEAWLESNDVCGTTAVLVIANQESTEEKPLA